MKKIIIILILVSTVFIQCEKDSDDSPELIQLRVKI